MRKLSRILAVLLAAIMVLGAFAACTPQNEDPTPEPKTTDEAKNTNPPENTPDGGEATNPPETQEPAASPVPDIPLVVAYSPFSQKFSPFYADTAYDQDVAGMVGLGLMVTDRMGGIIYNAIEGEDVSYNGTNYHYTGPADLKVEQKGDQTVYTAKIRNDLKFWDGTPITAKDILFTYYTYLDPSYVGSSSLASYPIVGLQNWRTQTSDEVYEKYADMAEAIFKAGNAGYAANDQYSEDLYNSYWDCVKESWTGTCQGIVDYCMSKYVDSYAEDMLGKTPEEVKASEGLQVAFGMAAWGFGEVGEEDGLFTDGEKTWDLENEFPTIEDYYNATYAKYEGDPVAFFDKESTGSETGTIVEIADDDFISTYGPQDPDMGGKGISSISGIKMIDEYTVEITLDGFSAPAVYSILGITITPMHYYGDTNKWDPDNGKYGFDFNDLSTQKAKTEVPRGAGPYVFDSYKDKVVTFKANENWYKGKPIIETIKFKETAAAEVATALKTGDADAGEMTGSRTRFEEVADLNGNGDIVGPIITTKKVDNLGYGYIGLNADTVNVGGNPSSAESKALRKALATVLAVYRDVSYDSYYGEAASVIQYPISNTSWAAPQASDPDYKIAFSVDPDGNDIYTASMTADDKYAAALEAALAWFEAAGYTVADGKVTVAPEGAKLDYEVIIPGDGNADHPSYNVLLMAKNALEQIGIELIINDPADSNVLWNRLDAGDQELWCAAWGSTIDPDMYQVYHGNNIVGKGGTDSNHYHINDAQLNELIMEARTSADQSFRKTVYKQCLEIIVDWAVEIPAYQRQNCTVFSTERINLDTLTPDITTFWGWMNDLEALQMQY
ncbi:MAG: ABC transporter substrate-binding protein [Clostridia bacterium]|nr:ABC transporter substrate-binding protein [Clostridia bacterium]